MNLMIVTNTRYLEYAYILLFTLFEQHEETNIDVYLPYEALSQEELEGLSTFVASHRGKRLIPLYVGDAFKKRVESRNGIGVETYYRILAIDMLPKTLDRILYLDVDMVVKGSLKALYETDITGHPFAVCEDIFGKINGFHHANMYRLGIPEEYSYFNAGVMLYNLEFLRADNACEKLLDRIYRDFERYEYNDQDVMNEMYFDKLLYVRWDQYNLPPAYYFARKEEFAAEVFSEEPDFSALSYASYDDLRAMGEDQERFSEYENIMDKLYRDAKIIHYLGDTKPWSTTREDSFPYHVFDWAYRSAADRFHGRLTGDSVRRILFLPYKAQMWDALESVYLAAKADPRCEVLLVPIPYKTYDKESETWNEVWEGEAFARIAPITDYRSIDFTKEVFDVAYIHNPFDEANNVTRVDERFYSANIKQFARMLVYIPYYVTSGFLSSVYISLPSSTYADVLVAQSEQYREGFQGHACYEKAVLLGSPKLDRVIRETRENKAFPKAWGIERFEGKLVMVNASIHQFLAYGFTMLEKLRYVFQSVRKYQDILLVWRPHPLLKSTLLAMRPELREVYDKLMQDFLADGLGVLDETDDISRVVALCDAYIGEDATSVINLFAVAGKPVFVLNCEITEALGEQTHAFLSGVVRRDADAAYVTADVGGLWEWDCSRDAALKPVDIKADKTVWRTPYSGLQKDGEDVYLVPYCIREPMAYDEASGQIVGLWGEQADCVLNDIGAVIWKDSIFYIPSDKSMLCRMGLRDPSVEFISAPLAVWKEHTPKQGGAISGYHARGQELWLVACDSNIIVKYDMETGKTWLFPVGDERFGYTALTSDDEYLYLAEAKSGGVIRWNERTGLDKVYKMPETFHAHQNIWGTIYAHARIVDAGDVLLCAPALADRMVRIEKRSALAESFLDGFWENAAKSAPGFRPFMSFTCNFMEKTDETHILIQRRRDGRMAVIDTETWEYEEKTPRYDPEMLEMLQSKNDGFEKVSNVSIYTRNESRFLTLDGFLADLRGGRLKEQERKQLADIQTMAVNTDGTAGEKIHAYMMGVIDGKGECDRTCL